MRIFSAAPAESQAHGIAGSSVPGASGPSPAALRAAAAASGGWAGPGPPNDEGPASTIWLPVGSPVHYYSRGQNSWIPARIKGHQTAQGYYELDVQPMAAQQRVRPLTPGTLVWYYSTSCANWIPGVIWDFDWVKGVYRTDVQAAAKPWMVRERAEMPDDAAAGNGRSRQAIDDTAVPSRGLSQLEGFDEFGTHSIHGTMARDRGGIDLTVDPRQNGGYARATGNAVSSSAGRPGGGVPPTSLVPEQFLQSEKQDSLSDLLVARLAAAQAAEDEPEAAVRRTERQFKCPLCLEEANTEEGVSLDCYHKLCAECFGGYCSSKIAEGRVMENELVCPATDNANKACGRTITVEQVQGNVDPELFDKFCMFRARNWMPNEEDGTLLRCPKPGCTVFMVAPTLENASCPNCGKKLCAKCGKDMHVGESCEAAAKREESGATEGDKQFEELCISQGWMRCPECKTPTELARGCYFMSCESDKCRGKTSFCYLCGVWLSAEDHAPGKSLAHFPKGPYNAECIHVSAEEYQERQKTVVHAEGDDESNPVMSLVEEARRFLEF